MEKRKTVHATLQEKSRKLTDLVVNQPRNKAHKRDLEDEIEQIRANLDYYNDSIKEVQQNIIEIEESKVKPSKKVEFLLSELFTLSCFNIAC